MHQNTSSLSSILLRKKELLRFVIVATVLSFSIGVLASLTAAQGILPVWTIYCGAVALSVVALIIIIADLRDGLSFTDEINAILFFEPESNQIHSVRNYRFARALSRTLAAVKAENRAIYAEWEREPLVSAKAPANKTNISNPAKKTAFAAIYRVTLDEEERRPSSATLLEEAVSFNLIETLSLHLSSYFDNSGDDKLILEHRREDLPASILSNRVLNLLSTPIEQRDIFFDAYPNTEDRPNGELCALYRQDGAMYSRFYVILPRGRSFRKLLQIKFSWRLNA